MTVPPQTSACDPPAVDEVRVFLTVLGTALRETVVKFEQTAAGVTDLVAKHVGRADRDLVVALQDFDRLQQEFANLADVLMAAAGRSAESWSPEKGANHPAEDAIAKISIAALKQRLLHYLGFVRSELTASPVAEEAVF